MPWPGKPSWLALLLLAATVGPPGTLAEGNVGCLYSERLCLEEEWCFDDFAFGRCLPATGDVDEDDLYRFNLEREELHELSAELRRLFALGYRWSHGYTQCRLQALLYATKHDMTFEPNSCSHLVDQDLEGALKVLEGQVPLEPQEVAIIKYTPSVDNPHADFADEVYYPPVDDRSQKMLREKIMPSNAINIMDMEDPYAEPEKRAWIPQMHRRSIPQYFNEQYNTPTGFRLGKETRDELEFLNANPEDSLSNNNLLSLDEMTEMYPLIKYLNDLQLSPEELQLYLSPDNYDRLAELLNQYQETSDFLEQKFQEQIPDERFTVDYNTPDNFRAGWESKDALPAQDEELDDQLSEPRIYIDEYNDGLNPNEGPANVETIFRERKMNPSNKRKEIFRELKALNDMNEMETWGNQPEMRPGAYAEGGMVLEPQNNNENLQDSDNFDAFLEKYNLGFKRPERLDVKKPGPPFDAQINAKSLLKGDVLLPTMMKKEPRGGHPNPSNSVTNNHDNDRDFISIGFKDGLKTYKQGNAIIGNISLLLGIDSSSFVERQVDPNGLSFKVKPNYKGYNASEVAKRIDAIKNQIAEITNAEIISIIVEDRYKKQTVFAAPINNTNQFYIVLFMVCGVLGAMILAALVLILIKRHIKSREKLQGLSRPDTEASKDYQDLCRARMASKGQPASSETVHGRITSLSRESEQSPSSRSSTSSWSEEPALHNMDISTGHMVLSYMEDHLKNKDRLDQEWVALCAYVAEPCETSIANKKDNKEKNRYPEIVPYDHARVVLNELSNAAGSDYINASSITDHDPRNPAYIATQGPLPHTAPDFWQLIWEQGAVVIVMLTRLTEGGAAMCHRYWPEEGSEIYHIYEVHLVSEHIWCDDYLVRSFYLKNVRTGETRTVTQFHFLSWPESGVPASTKALLEFRRKVNKSYRGRSCPIVVHCSDGAGRTGTYCLIDMVLSRMAKGAKEIDIAATLEHLRDQRPRMVATKQQFEFVLTAVAEEVHAILKALPPQPSPAQVPDKDKEKQ